MSNKTGLSKGIHSINNDIQSENDDDKDAFNYEEGKSYGEISPNDRRINSGGKLTLKPNHIRLNKNSLRPSHQLFELLEMEISRHKNHSLQNYFEIVGSKRPPSGRKSMFDPIDIKKLDFKQSQQTISPNIAS